LNPKPRPSLTIFVQNKIGGVQFYYANLVRTGAFRDFDVRYIALENPEEPDAKLNEPLPGAPSVNFRHGWPANLSADFRALARQLKRIPPGLLLTNFRFELACLDVHRRPDLTVVHICHDELYVDIALKNAHNIDVFIAHNPYFTERLKALLPAERAADVYFLPFGVQQDAASVRSPNPKGPLRVIFIGRLHRKKGVLDLPLVDDALRELGVRVEWTLLGRGPDQEALEREIAGKDNFAIRSPKDGMEMLREASSGDVLLLPSRMDGTPLAVMEAMSVGLVPVISEFNPGAHWMAPPETGFVCSLEPGAFARIVADLDADRPKLEAMSQAALARARAEFEVNDKAGAYASLFDRWQTLRRPHPMPPKRYGTWLDQPLAPNWVTKNLRRLKRWRKSFS
jgi:glycosyltransferase involved in cell wall biosynthesis